MDTVEALQSALASEADVQLVVSNHLLDTPEFRALMQNMEQGEEQQQQQQQHHHNPLTEEEESSSSDLTRFSHETLDESRDGFEAAASSNSSSSRSFLQPNSHSNSLLTSLLSSENSLMDSNNDDDEDITLQDLIAVETIDESQMPADDGDDDEKEDTADKDDMLWTNQLSMDSFQYISHVLGYAGPFRCEKCGLHYTSLNDYRAHGGRCSSKSTSQKPQAANKKGSGPKKALLTTSFRPEEEVKCERTVVVARVKVEEESSSSWLPGTSSHVVSKQAGPAGGILKSEPTVAGQVSIIQRC